jgi:hypothetical protein
LGRTIGSGAGGGRKVLRIWAISSVSWVRRGRHLKFSAGIIVYLFNKEGVEIEEQP